MLYIVGVSGKAGAGKDTLVDYMQSRLTDSGMDSDRFAFAKGVKIFGKRYFGEICDPVVKDPTSRLVLQGIGQMMRSEVSEDYWVNRARHLITEKAQQAGPSKDLVIFITDVRYKNEADALSVKNWEFFNTGNIDETKLLVRINGRTSLTGEAALHPSETDLDDYTDFDTVYDNVASLEDLYAYGDAVLKRIIHD